MKLAKLEFQVAPWLDMLDNLTGHGLSRHKCIGNLPPAVNFVKFNAQILIIFCHFVNLSLE